MCMWRPFGNPWLRYAIVTGFGLLAAEFAAPATAHASCGDYVVVGSEHQGQHDSSMPSVRPQSVPRKPSCGHGSSPSQPGNAPCSGPQCSRNETPAPASPTTTMERPQETAHLCSGGSPIEAESIPLWAYSQHQVPVWLFGSAIRPPPQP